MIIADSSQDILDQVKRLHLKTVSEFKRNSIAC